MLEHAEALERRHGRYLRYAAEARELAARTTDSVREHHVRVALAWEAMARKLAAQLPEPKPRLLQTVGAASNAVDRARLALGRRTEAIRGRLAERFMCVGYRSGAGLQDSETNPHIVDDPS